MPPRPPRLRPLHQPRPPHLPLSKPHRPALLPLARTFHPSPRHQGPPHNRIFSPVRSDDEWLSLLLLSATNRVPLLTLWTASWCPTCRVVAPLLHELIERDGVGEKEGGVGFVEVELDAPDAGALAARYLITSLPTLLSFSRQEAQMLTKVTSAEELRDREFLKRWIEREAERGGKGGAGGGGGGGGVLARLFGWGTARGE